jgi:glycolate oxidase FAD binding subunit
VLDVIAEAGAAAGIRPAVSGPAGAGALYACLDPGTSDADAVRFVTMLRDHVAGALGSAAPRGRVAVLAAPPAVLAASWDRAVPGLALMRAVRDQFDPDHRMFPGRGAGPAGRPPMHGGGD